MSDLSNNLRLLMEKENISKAELARKIGVHPTSVSNWLNDVSAPQPKFITKLGTVFGYEPYSLLSSNPVKKKSVSDMTEEEAKKAIEEDDALSKLEIYDLNSPDFEAKLYANVEEMVKREVDQRIAENAKETFSDREKAFARFFRFLPEPIQDSVFQLVQSLAEELGVHHENQ